MTLTARTVTSPPTGTCDPDSRVTRSLLGYGVLAGPVYVTASLVQAVTRPGFDLSRHEWSLLATGHQGWLQITNLALTGAMVLAFAAGLRRALAGGPAATWAPRLIGVYGASLVAAGAFRADPAYGFPAGTPDGPGAVSWHGVLHLLSGVVGFGALAAACFVIARRYRCEGRRASAIVARATGILFPLGFGAVAAGAGRPAANLAFTAAVVVVWAWLAVVAVDRYRSTGLPSTDRCQQSAGPRGDDDALPDVAQGGPADPPATAGVDGGDRPPRRGGHQGRRAAGLRRPRPERHGGPAGADLRGPDGQRRAVRRGEGGRQLRRLRGALEGRGGRVGHPLPRRAPRALAGVGRHHRHPQGVRPGGHGPRFLTPQPPVSAGPRISGGPAVGCCG